MFFYFLNEGVEESLLSASEFLYRIAALIPPPRKHRYRYFGVHAPNSPCCAMGAVQFVL